MKPTRTTNRRRLWLFRALAVVLGLSLFAVAELVCVVFDWGRPTTVDDPFVGFSAVHPLFELDDAGDVYHVPESRRKFFAPESFPAAKPQSMKRVFCLGGSTVQGRPYSTPTAFPTWLEIGLNEADESHRWDTVNCGGISYASYRLVPILEECLQYQPDLFVICTGHNEFLEDRSYGHLKEPPAALAVPQRFASRLRIFTLLRSLAARIRDDGTPTAGPRPELPPDTDPILDYHDSLKAYHRDAAWQAGVVAHYEFNLRRMLERARAADVPVLLVLPPSNLGDTPPFKSEHSAGLGAEELAMWQRFINQAGPHLRGDPSQAVASLKAALEIDPVYAATWYDLGHCYQRVGLHKQAREAFVKSRDLDVCPLRMISQLEDAMRRVAQDNDVPLIDAHALLEAECEAGILDGTQLVDHVHPNFAGHQRIADAILGEFDRQGWVKLRANWESSVHAAYERHFDSLEDFYFLKGQRTLDAVRGWTQGQADGPPAAQRFPQRIRFE